MGEGRASGVVVVRERDAENDPVEVQVSPGELLLRALEHLHRVLRPLDRVLVLHVIRVPEALARLVPEAVIEVDVGRPAPLPGRGVGRVPRLRVVLVPGHVHLARLRVGEEGLLVGLEPLLPVVGLVRPEQLREQDVPGRPDVGAGLLRHLVQDAVLLDHLLVGQFEGPIDPFGVVERIAPTREVRGRDPDAPPVDRLALLRGHLAVLLLLPHGDVLVGAVAPLLSRRLAERGLRVLGVERLVQALADELHGHPLDRARGLGRRAAGGHARQEALGRPARDHGVRHRVRVALVGAERFLDAAEVRQRPARARHAGSGHRDHVAGPAARREPAGLGLVSPRALERLEDGLARTSLARLRPFRPGPGRRLLTGPDVLRRHGSPPFKSRRSP